MIIRTDGTDSAVGRSVGSDRKGYVSLVLYGAGIVIAHFSPWLSYATYVLVAMFWFIPDRRIERVMDDRLAGNFRQLVDRHHLIEDDLVDRIALFGKQRLQLTFGIGAGGVEQHALLRPHPAEHFFGQGRGIAIGAFDVVEAGFLRRIGGLRSHGEDAQVAPLGAPGQSSHAVGAGGDDRADAFKGQFGSIEKSYREQRSTKRLVAAGA